MIDKKPAVGRILIKSGYLRGEFFRAAGVITKVTAATVQFRTSEGDLSFIHRRNMAAVVDTLKEAKELTDFSEYAWKEVVALERRLANAAEGFFK